MKKESIEKRLKGILGERGMQSRIAREAGLSAGLISRIVSHGIAGCSDKTLEALGRAIEKIEGEGVVKRQSEKLAATKEKGSKKQKSASAKVIAIKPSKEEKPTKKGKVVKSVKPESRKKKK